MPIGVIFAAILLGQTNTVAVGRPSAPSVAPLATLRDAEAYAASRGVLLSDPRSGAHATREGRTLYDETVYRANGRQPLTVLRFADAATARDMASVVVEADPAARALIRGQIVFLVSGDADLLARLTATPALPTSFEDVETLLASKGLVIATRTPVEPTSGPASVDYTLTGGGRVSVYRFENEAAASRFREGATKDGDRALARGMFVFLVPRDAGETGVRVFDLLAAR